MALKTDKLVLRVSVDVSETDYGSGIYHGSTKFTMDKDTLEIPVDDIGQSARSLIKDAFNLPAVGAALDALVKSAEDAPDDTTA